MTAVNELLVADAATTGIRKQLGSVWIRNEYGRVLAAIEIPEWLDGLTPKVLECIEVGRRDAAETSLRDAAAAWESYGDDTPDVALWLRARAAGCTCGDPVQCFACGAVLCPTCDVGEKSWCDHRDGPLCVGCDIEACGDCSRDFAAERSAATASDGRLP
jgi:hypothetical protein